MSSSGRSHSASLKVKRPARTVKTLVTLAMRYMLFPSTFLVPWGDAAISGEVWWNCRETALGSSSEKRPMEKVIFWAPSGSRLAFGRLVLLLMLVPPRPDASSTSVRLFHAVLTRLRSLVRSLGARKLGPEKSPNTPDKNTADKRTILCP